MPHHPHHRPGRLYGHGAWLVRLAYTLDSCSRPPRNRGIEFLADLIRIVVAFALLCAVLVLAHV